MRYLNVPYAEKEAAKALGARWDSIARRWYIPQSLLEQQNQFSRWYLNDDVSVLEPHDLFEKDSEDLYRPVNDSNRQKIPVESSQTLASLGYEMPSPHANPSGITPHETLNHSLLTNSLTPKGKKLSEFLQQVQYALQGAMAGGYWVIAEVANIQKRGGHYYLELTETNEKGIQLAKSRAMIWSRTANQILPTFEKNTGKSIENGHKLLILVQVSFHAQYGFSLQIEDIDASFTLGEMERALVELREQLDREKRLTKNKLLALPNDYFSVAVIAPPKAAGLGDFQADAIRLSNLGLCHFDYFYATFQGEKLAGEIPKSFEKIASQSHLYDVAVIIRGGGAKLDLQQLNQYPVAKALSDMPIPVITGIGHEKDNCILDEMAAMRCDTPSKVIGFIESQIVNQAQTAKQNWQVIQQYTQTSLHKKREHLAKMQGIVQQGAWQNWRNWQALLTPMSREISARSRRRISQKSQQLEMMKQRVFSASLQQVLLTRQDCSQTLKQIQQFAPQAYVNQKISVSNLLQNIHQLAKQKLLNLRNQREKLTQLEMTIINEARQNCRIWQSRLDPLNHRVLSQSRRHAYVQNQKLISLQQQIRNQMVSKVSWQRKLSEQLYSNIQETAPKMLIDQRQALQLTYKLILSSGTDTQLARGFAVTKSQSGEVITKAEMAKREKTLELIYQDGSVWVVVPQSLK